MPSGITHDRITLWTLPWIVGITYGFTRNGEVTLILSGGFLFSGLMFGPDLDIHSIQYKRWGLFKGIWLPYRNLFRHRSLFSHGLIIGSSFVISCILYSQYPHREISHVCYRLSLWLDFVCVKHFTGK